MFFFNKRRSKAYHLFCMTNNIQPNSKQASKCMHFADLTFHNMDECDFVRVYESNTIESRSIMYGGVPLHLSQFLHQSLPRSLPLPPSLFPFLLFLFFCFKMNNTCTRFLPSFISIYMSVLVPPLPHPHYISFKNTQY
jgi:hypothetical protein